MNTSPTPRRRWLLTGLLAIPPIAVGLAAGLGLHWMRADSADDPVGENAQEGGTNSFYGSGDAILPIRSGDPVVMSVYVEAADEGCRVAPVDETGTILTPNVQVGPDAVSEARLTLNWDAPVASRIEVTGRGCTWAVALHAPAQVARHLHEVAQSVSGRGSDVIALPAGADAEVWVQVDGTSRTTLLAADDEYDLTPLTELIDGEHWIKIPPGTRFLVVQSNGGWTVAVPINIRMSPNDEG
jgi:hypothetical protein